MVNSRQVRFDGSPPSIQTIVERVRQRTGIQASYLTDKWLLTNPAAPNDMFSLYQEGENALLLMNEGTETMLLQATLYTLLELGGYYEDWYE